MDLVDASRTLYAVIAEGISPFVLRIFVPHGRSNTTLACYLQFWRNTEDADVLRFLKLFTELSLDRIRELGQLKGADINKAKVIGIAL